jgi:hypothetical protein
VSVKTTPGHVVGNGRAGLVPPPGQSLPTRVRRHGLIAVGVLLVAASALVAAMLYSNAGGKVTVIVTARPVAAGHVITRADLSTAQLSAHSVPALAASHMDRIVGKIAAVGLVAGQVLNPDMITDQAPLPTDSAVVGIALKPGQLPADGLQAGDNVMVVILAPPSGTSTTVTAPTVLAGSAPVVGSAALPATSGYVVSVAVPRSSAAQLASASSSGLVALVKVSR